MVRLTFRTKRTSLIALLGFPLFCLTNLLLDWSVFGEYDDEVFAVCIVLLFLYVYVIGPTRQEIEEHRRLKDSGTRL